MSTTNREPKKREANHVSRITSTEYRHGTATRKYRDDEPSIQRKKVSHNS